MKPAIGQIAAKVNERPTQFFRKKYNAGPRLTPEQKRRQSDVLRHAWSHFGEPVGVIAFLNTRHVQLDGQPLHVAVESDDGLMRVEGLLKEMTLKC